MRLGCWGPTTSIRGLFSGLRFVPLLSGRRLLIQLAAEKVADCRADLGDVGLEREVAGVEEPDLRVRDVALEGLGAGRQEERVVPAPEREQRRPAAAEIFLEFRLERDIAGIVEEEIKLDLVNAGTSE